MYQTPNRIHTISRSSVALPKNQGRKLIPNEKSGIITLLPYTATTLDGR